MSSTKLKGIAYPTGVDNPVYKRAWDVADYVYPANSESSVTIITNAVITPQQTPGTCSEDPEIGPTCDCTEDECSGQCIPDTVEHNSNGIKTGNCVNSSSDASVRVCEIRGWCPVEVDQLPSDGVLLDEAVNFTLFVRNTVQFSKFDFEKRNVLNPDSLRGCRYSKENPYCPIFKVGDMLEWAGVTFDEIATDGGILGIFVTWNCDLDMSWSHCHPKYDFERLDDPESGGHNFRFAKFYRKDQTEYRDLVKAYGIRFDVIIKGTGRRFDIVSLVNNIAAGLALLTVATIVCDFVILYIVKNREFYKNQKYAVVTDDPAFGENIAGYGSLDETPLEPSKDKTGSEND